MATRDLSMASAEQTEILSGWDMEAEPVIYIDLEASGLGDRSWPIEVGWARGKEDPQSILIAPHPDWPMAAWDDNAEALHGLSVEQLQCEGLDPVHACKHLNNALAGGTVYSDAPDWDGFWLYRLHQAARMKQTFKLAHYAELMPPVDLNAKMTLVAKANAVAPHTHRAGDDVRHMQVLHALVTKLTAG